MPDQPASGVHPKVAAATVGGLCVTVVMLAITQYAPHYAPNADLSAAITTFVTALTGYWKGS
jgi:hypothetical protein